MGIRTNRIVAAILSCALLLNYSYVFAHGGGTPRLTNEPAGPYQLFAWSSPEPLQVGEIHITFAVVLSPEGNKPVDETTLFNDLDQVVTGAEIEVTFTNLTSTDLGEDGQLRFAAVPSAINPLYYEVDADFPSAGEWEISINVDGELGNGSGTFVGSVQEAPLIDWRIVIGIITLLLVAIWMGRRRSTLQS